VKLDVLPDPQPQQQLKKQPWYADGLNFTCTMCGNCCGGAPGYVWINRDDVVRIAEYLKITPEEMVERHSRKVGGKWSLKEGKGPGSDYDCVFLREEKVTKRTSSGEEVKLARRYCSVYPVRPLQCRTWPFWRENLTSRKAWELSGKRCHGMDHGTRRFTIEQIHAIRDAEKWPENPPTSAPTARTRKSKEPGH
jgi:Fe-S-cluster containining protein